MIYTACGVRVTHIPTGVEAEVSSVCFVPTSRLHEHAFKILRQRMWTHRNTPLPPTEVAKYEFDGTGEDERLEDFLESRLSDRR